ncbi:adenylate cyclase [Salmonella enterica subsp. enterica serovar Virchow]|nr:adenylate cyclase [Salmonella enterica subsp. enterica serovar Virchow]MIL09074.1 CYTH domain-containing protein [Salmonella enterica subsp. enterica serovar Enteritidis]
MATEIERKFLVRSDAWRDRVEASIVMRQFYLAVGSDRSVRIRIADGRRAKLTLKFGSNLLIRDEFEYSIDLADALEMEAHAVGDVIEKTRYHVRHAGYLYEVDVFDGKLAGLIVAELETPDRVATAQLPAWLGREVTGDQRYSNATLAVSTVTEPTVRALAS